MRVLHAIERLVVIAVAIGAIGQSVAAGDDTPSNDPLTTASARITLEVDATDLPRQLARSSMTISALPGPMDLHYVLWSPGNHSPSGPIQNVVDLVITDCKGQPIEWFRDPGHVTKLSIVVPEGCDEIRVDMAYIASQPGVLSGSTDTYGRPTFGGLNWNTVLLYPGGLTHQQIEVQASLAVPQRWKHATSLVEMLEPSDDMGSRLMNDPSEARWIDFAPVNLAELVDSPVMMGEHLHTYELDAGAIAPHWMHIVADDPALTELPEWLEAKFEAMIRQSLAIFNRPGQQHFPRDRFHFLMLMGDELRFGVEHATCTFIGSGARSIVDAEASATKGGGRGLSVVPHEYFHSWCAKLAAPRGLILSDYHTAPSTDLLWVYEGLTTYYTGVISVRSGLTTFTEYLDGIRSSIVRYQRQSGRLWRPVVDTARSVQSLRGSGRYWSERRMGLEYYGQGAMFWLEADALIRVGSRGRRSLDDFCARLFDVEPLPVGAQATYARQDIVETLSTVYGEVDWDGLIRKRLEQPQQVLDMTDLLDRIGYRLTFHDEPTDAQVKAIKRAKNADLRTSLGILVNMDGEVTEIVPGSPADIAKLAYGMEVVAVDGFVFTSKRLRDAVNRSDESESVTLTVRFGQRLETIEIAYSGGPRHPKLEHDPVRVDVLTQIAKPKVFAPAR